MTSIARLLDITRKCSKALTLCIFLTRVLNGSKYFPTILGNVGLHVPNRNSAAFSSCNVDFKYRNCPSDRCASAAVPSTVIPIYSMDVRSRLVIG